MSGLWNPETGQREVYSTLEGGMVPTGRPMDYRAVAGVDYCGYCKYDLDEQGNCHCDGHGGPLGNVGMCGYCGDYIFFETGCSCDGFGNEKAPSLPEESDDPYDPAYHVEGEEVELSRVSREKRPPRPAFSTRPRRERPQFGV